MLKINIICKPHIYTEEFKNPKVFLNYDIKRNDTRVHEIPNGDYTIQSIAVINNGDIEDVTQKYVKDDKVWLRDVVLEIVSDYNHFKDFNYF